MSHYIHIKEFISSYAIQGHIRPSLPNKKPMSGVVTLFFMLLKRGLSETPETVQNIDIIPDSTPEHDDKILFLKTAHMLVTRYGEIKSALIRKLLDAMLCELDM